MAEGIHISITNGNGNGTTRPKGNGARLPQADDTNFDKFNSGYGKFQSVLNNQLVQFGINSAKQIGSNFYATYVENTQDYFRKTSIDNHLSTLSTMASFGLNVGGRLASGDVGGALVYSGIAIMGSVVNEIMNQSNIKRQNVRANRSSAFNSTMIGSILEDGSRWI